MNARGQTLVLFALALFLLTLAVLATIGLGVRIKERTELQTVADVAAYNNAVITARTFNSLAIVNRTEWSMLVAQSAAQSYMSWATAYRGALDGAGDTLPRNPACAGVRQSLNDERQRVDALWSRLEPAGHAELRRLANLQRQLLREDSQKDYARLEKLVNKEKALEVVLKAAGPGSVRPMVSADSYGKFNKDQISRDCITGAACDIASSDFDKKRRNFTIMRHQHEIYMGTRGDPFTTSRRDNGALGRKLQSVLGPFSTVTWAGHGSSYRSHSIFTHSADFAFGPGNADYPQMSPDSPMSDDHGNLRITLAAGLCVANVSLAVETFLRNSANTAENVHTWSSQGVVRHCPGEHQASHTMPDLGQAQSWPLIIDFNDHVAESSGRLYGQPRNKVELTRDPRPRQADPWDLAFTFAGKRYDPSRMAGQPRALATGIAYYHRADDWEEPPNFVNPFWQATLISSRWDTP